MRLDKYLKVTRLIKRRTVAKVLIDESNILINKKIAKPSSNVNVGDIIDIKLGMRLLKIEVLGLSEYTDKNHSKELFKIINEDITTN